MDRLAALWTVRFDGSLEKLQKSGLLPVLLVLYGLINYYILYQLFRVIYTSFIAHRIGMTVRWMPSPTTWAVITGATNGLGMEYANRLSEMGYSLLLLSRNMEKLEKTRTILMNQNRNCKNIKVLEVDFTKLDIYDSIKSELDKLETIDVLVNSVGMFTPMEYFHKSFATEKTSQDIVYCNTVSTTQMISLCLPRMLENRRGIIINISSFAASVPAPMMSLYSASKVYVDFLSRALEIEYRDKGIVIQSVMPGAIGNKLYDPKEVLERYGLPMADIMHSPLGRYINNVRANEFVAEAIKTVGAEKQTAGHWRHKLLDISVNFNKKFVSEDLVSKFYFNAIKFKKSGYSLNSILFATNDNIDDY